MSEVDDSHMRPYVCKRCGPNNDYWAIIYPNRPDIHRQCKKCYEHKRIIPPTRLQEGIDLYKLGRSVKESAKAVGMHPSTLYAHMKKLGGVVRNKSAAASRKVLIQQSHLKPSTLAKKFNLSIGTVLRMQAEQV